jgi:hypothetical protein
MDELNLAPFGSTEFEVRVLLSFEIRDTIAVICKLSETIDALKNLISKVF